MENVLRNKIVSAVIQQLRKTENGTQTCTSQLVDAVFSYKTFSNGTYFYEECSIEDMEFFEIDRMVREQAPKEGIILDSSRYAGMAIGLPYNCPYVVRHKKRRKI